MHIDEADLVPPFVIYEKPLPLPGGNAYTRIQYINLEILRMLDEAHLDFTAFRPLENTMDHRIFHQRLQEQRRYLDIIQLILWEIVGDFQPVAKPRPFQLRVAFNDMKFLRQGMSLEGLFRLWRK